MKILFLSDNFPPETNAPATRTYEHAVEWVRAGHEVTVITTAPNFPEGRLFAGYRNAWRTAEIVDAIQVIRVKTYITANEGFLRRSLDYVSFMVMGGLAALFHPRPDVIVTTSPQFFCAMAGWGITRLRRLPWIFELRDLWPASIVAVGAMRKSRVIRWLEWIELQMYRDADAVVSVTHAFKADLVRRGIDPAKIQVILNGVDLSRYRPIPKDEALLDQLDLRGKFVVGYLGTHGMAHALDKVADTATLLRDHPGIVFLFAGAGAKRAELEETVRARKLTNVRLIPPQPKAMMPRLWSIHDLALIPLRNQELFTTVIPSKIFEAMAMGTPVLLSVPEGEATRLVRATACGFPVPPEDSQAMADTIVRLKDNPDECARFSAAGLAAASHYSRDQQAALMLDVLANAWSKSRSPR
jgi:glycosyltransferase involved in cell wall biosynthesis